MDETLLPHVQGQSDVPVTVCVGVQPGELPAATGAASRRRALVASNAKREAGQDQSQGNPTHQVRHVSTGRGYRDTAVVCRDPGRDHPVGDPATKNARMCELNKSTRKTGPLEAGLCAAGDVEAALASLTVKAKPQTSAAARKFEKPPSDKHGGARC